MKPLASAYFFHPYIWIYFILLFSLGAVSVALGVLQSHWYLVALPILFLPFFEWWAHKFLLHAKVDPVGRPQMYRYMRRLHYQHHEDPKDIEHIFAPLSASIFVFVGFYLFFSLLLWSFKLAVLATVGVVGLYLYYEWIHLAHHTRQYRPMTSFGRKLKLAHSWHHYHNENYWWGITTYGADVLLKTYKSPDQIPKSGTHRYLS